MSYNILNEVDLFYIRLKKGWVTDEEKQSLYELVVNLEERTMFQKERFILLYNLKQEQNEKYNYTSLGRMQGCSCSAIKYSIGRIKNALANLDEERKKVFLDIVNRNDYFTKINQKEI